MEIDNKDLMTVQGQFAVGMQKKSLDVTAGLVTQLIDDSVAVADQALCRSRNWNKSKYDSLT